MRNLVSEAMYQKEDKPTPLSDTHDRLILIHTRSTFQIGLFTNLEQVFEININNYHQ